MSLRPGLPALTLGLALTLTGCGEGTVAVDSPVADPYDGPMHVEPDFSDDATVLERSGAAGLALECAGDPYQGGGGDYVDSGLERVQPNPREALADFRDQAGPGLPQDGFVVERAEDDRVLLSWDVAGETRIAVVVADGIRDWSDDTGWGVETWARCDPAELPPEVAEALGEEVWEDAEGNRVPVTTVTSSAGPEHCGWQDIVFLSLGNDGYPADRTYLRDVHGELQRLLHTTFSGSAALPDDATDTGYRHDGRQLWLAADGRAAYLVDLEDDSDVERWPAAREPIGCA